MDFLLNGGKSTASRLVIEAIYLGGTTLVFGILSAVVQNPEVFQPQWVLIARLLLGLVANLSNPKVPNV